MEQSLKEKALMLVGETRVMTLGVAGGTGPWTAPVYFVYHDEVFYFFSNEQSRHIQDAAGGKMISASVFHDSDRLDQIFGFQMAGTLEEISKIRTYLKVVGNYVSKFNFLRQAFGPQILEDRHFFLERFKSRLYGFHPETIFLSDNSRTTGKRTEIDLGRLFLEP